MVLRQVLIFMLVLTAVVLIPNVTSSRDRLQGGTRLIAEDTAIKTQDLDNILEKGLEKGASSSPSSSSALLAEERVVPTGPDPLHHNDNPIKP